MLHIAMLKIVLADDHTLVRQEIRTLLEEQSDFLVVGEASDGIEAVEITNEQKPDILVSDLRMPRLDGIGVTERVRQLSPDTAVIILSMYGSRLYVDAAFRAGARGYVLKKSCLDGLTEAVRTVAAGERYLNLSISENM